MNISKNQYISLREILSIFELHSKLNSLSESYATLKNHTKKRLFLLQMRKKTISLKSEKMTIVAEKRKKFDSFINKIFTKNFVFFDFKNVFQIFLFFEKYFKKMHIDMTKFHDCSSKLWHFHSWVSSIKITSKQYAHYFNFSFFFFRFCFFFVLIMLASNDISNEYMK